MTTSGGGWTMVMRTNTDGVANLALLTNYSSLYSTPIGTASGSAPMRVPAQHWAALGADGDIMSYHELRKTDGSSCDPLRYALFGGTLTVPAPASTGTITYAYSGADPHRVAQNQNPASVSTSDRGPSQVCINTHKASPWFYASCGTNLPSFAWILFPTTAPQPAISDLVLGTGLDGYNETSACAGAARQQPASGWNAENVHAYFLR
jgi:hypothetical protein